MWPRAIFPAATGYFRGAPRAFPTPSPKSPLKIYAPGGTLPGITNFTAAPWWTLRQYFFWEDIEQVNQVARWVRDINGVGIVHNLCAFDPVDSTTQPLHTDKFSWSGAMIPLPTAEQMNAVITKATARNQLVSKLFPHWAAIATYAQSMKLGVVWSGSDKDRTLSQAAYVAFGKIRPDGTIYNEGRYVIERDSINTNGFHPVAFCALIRKAEPY